MKIVIFGVSGYLDTIESLLQENVNILFYLDNSPEKQMKFRNGKKICPLEKLADVDFDYIVIAAMNYQGIEQQLFENGVRAEKIISFFKDSLFFGDYSNIFQLIPCMQYSLESRFKYYMNQMEHKQILFSNNYIYEMADAVRRKNIQLPKICTVEETLQKILHDKVSVSRYGDGEFQIILGSAKDVYQDDNEELGRRLEEILVSNLANHIVALADDYGCMDGLREENKFAIRKYMTEEKRRHHYHYIDMGKQYYNAYISRPYVIYSHDQREKAYDRFIKWKKIWDGKKLLLVEGSYTRMGVGNNLFSNAESIERIITPNKNAYSVYQEILKAVMHVEKDRLVLIALGPAATVLAYDLAQEGYWAIDVGHLDLEYEWYLKGEGYSRIPNKYNNEVVGGTIVEDIVDENYDKSIIRTIME